MFKTVEIKDNIFNSIHTRHVYNDANQSTPNGESCYADAERAGKNERLELASKDPSSGKIISLYKVNNPYKLNKAQWDSYVRNCQWF